MDGSLSKVRGSLGHVAKGVDKRSESASKRSLARFEVKRSPRLSAVGYSKGIDIWAIGRRPHDQKTKRRKQVQLLSEIQVRGENFLGPAASFVMPIHRFIQAPHCDQDSQTSLPRIRESFVSRSARSSTEDLLLPVQRSFNTIKTCERCPLAATVSFAHSCDQYSPTLLRSPYFLLYWREQRHVHRSRVEHRNFASPRLFIFPFPCYATYIILFGHRIDALISSSSLSSERRPYRHGGQPYGKLARTVPYLRMSMTLTLLVLEQPEAHRKRLTPISSVTALTRSSHVRHST